METATVQQVLNQAIFRLRLSRRDALRELQTQVKIGQAIRAQRLRDMRDLDEARREKQEWVQRTMELLGRLVTTEQWAEQFNDFVPTILPEYAEFGMFVEVFEEEMRHRLGRLNGFLKALNDIPEPPPLQTKEPAAEPSPPHPEVPVSSSKEPTMSSQPAQQMAPSIILPQEEPPRARVAAPPQPPPPQSQMPSLAAGVLIARSADTTMRDAVVQFLQRLGVSLQVIDRQQPQGSAMHDELSRRRDASFALVLSDTFEGAHQSHDDLFDLGCCVGRLGAARVFALHHGGDASIDRFGIGHVPIDGSEGWQLQLARLLRKSGVAVDLNRLV